jgi:hypothetical protein
MDRGIAETGANDPFLLDLWRGSGGTEVVEAGPPGIAAVVPARDCLVWLDRCTIAAGLGLSGRGSQLAEIAASHDKAVVTEGSAARGVFGSIREGDGSGRRGRREVVELREEGDGGGRVLGLLGDLGRGELLKGG